MILKELALPGSYLVEPKRFDDSRGFFATVWDETVCAEKRLPVRFCQHAIVFNEKRATLRGMHFQLAPGAQAKVVRCTSGAAYDVIVDLRPGTATFGRWVAVELTANNRLSLYVPEGFAHGYQTLEDRTELLYQISTPYRPDLERGLRWNDPRYAISWPLPDPIISPRDAAFPLAT